MNYTTTYQVAIASRFRTMSKHLSGWLATSTLLLAVSCSSPDRAVVNPQVDPILQQAVFTSPEAAANTFVQAVKNQDEEVLSKVLQADFREVLPLDEVTRGDVDNFIDAWEEYHTLLPEGDDEMLLAVGKGKWTLPIPIVAGASGWYFDLAEGRERMRIRRLGRNELGAIQAVLAYYDAQLEYAERDRNGDGMLEYARRFISTPGTRDGLYWPVEGDGTPSPLGTLLADRTAGGGYHGYFYRILEAQGKSAAGGEFGYLIGNRMRSGFALVAWPEEYGESGIMSFMVSHEGIVQERNLGPDGAEVAEEMVAYDPGPGWIPSREANGAEPIVE